MLRGILVGAAMIGGEGVYTREQLEEELFSPEITRTREDSNSASVDDSDTSDSSDNSMALEGKNTSSLSEYHPTRPRRMKFQSFSSSDIELSNAQLDLSTATSRESLLDELLGDIRRSCPTSLASTPTMVSYSEGEGESVFDYKLKRSETELAAMDISELKELAGTLSAEVDCVSSLLVRLLHVKDKRGARAQKQADRLSAILRDYARKNGLCSELSFSLHPPASPDDHQNWLNAWRVLSHLPKGIPKSWRKILWSGLTSISTISSLDWPSIFLSAFSEYAMPGDETLGMQIVKDLHRTGDTGFTSEEEHALLKRVLLAYARFNKATGYCQGFNILAALILKVVGFDEQLTLKIMVYLIDYLLPENYFAQNLYTLSVDMAVFRELLKHVLPELSMHIENLQKEASGTIKKSYSSENPPDITSMHAYEPPLADVFTMQWFLTIFASALPRKATRRVWDLIFLEGSEVLLYTGAAIMAVMEKDLLQTSTAADFYSTMARLGERLRKSQLLPSAEFIQVVYTIQECITSPDSSIPPIKRLREKYTYNVCPCAQPEDEEEGEAQRRNMRPCPKPSRGGAFSIAEREEEGVSSDKSKNKKKKNNARQKGRMKEKEFVDGQRNLSLPEDNFSTSTPIKTQIKLLEDHYLSTARQPATVWCAINLAPPHARAVCPQIKYGGVVAGPADDSVYGVDVPDEVVEKSKVLGGQITMERLAQQRKNVFTISCTQPFSRDEECQLGMELGLESRSNKRKNSFQGKSGVLGNTEGLRGKVYMSERERLRLPGKYVL